MTQIVICKDGKAPATKIDTNVNQLLVVKVGDRDHPATVDDINDVAQALEKGF